MFFKLSKVLLDQAVIIANTISSIALTKHNEVVAIFHVNWLLNRIFEYLRKEQPFLCTEITLELFPSCSVSELNYAITARPNTTCVKVNLNDVNVRILKPPLLN